MSARRSLPPGFRLDRGAHEPPNGEFAACLVEAAAWIAGEPWSDHPECVCPVIAGFCRLWNDALADEDRQILLPYASRIVGTAHGADVAERLALMATDWLVCEYAPAWLRLAGLDEHAHALERLAPLDSRKRVRAARPSVAAARAAAWNAAAVTAAVNLDGDDESDVGSAVRAAASAAYRAAASAAYRAAAWDAAGDAARAVARNTAGDAAWDAARAAARAVARNATWDAARAAAWDAAGDAARAVARNAAGDAAWDAARAAARAVARNAAWDAARAAAWDAAAERLDPTKRALQRSALRLLDRMIEVTP